MPADTWCDKHYDWRRMCGCKDPFEVLRAQLVAMTKERDEARDEAITDSLVRNGLAEDMRQDLCAAIARAEKAEAELQEIADAADPDADRWVYTPPHASKHAGEVVTVLGRGQHRSASWLRAIGWVETVRYIDAQGTHRSRPVHEFNKLFVKKVKP